MWKRFRCALQNWSHANCSTSVIIGICRVMCDISLRIVCTSNWLQTNWRTGLVEWKKLCSVCLWHFIRCVLITSNTIGMCTFEYSSFSWWRVSHIQPFRLNVRRECDEVVSHSVIQVMKLVSHSVIQLMVRVSHSVIQLMVLDSHVSHSVIQLVMLDSQSVIQLIVLLSHIQSLTWCCAVI